MFLGFALFACSEEAPFTGGDGGGNKEPLKAGEALLNMAIDNNKKGGTYAATTLEAHPSEREIKSIAIFTKTDNVSTFGQPDFLLGAFNKFFSDEEIGAPWGLNDPLTDIGDGKYTVSVRVKSEGFGPKTKVIMIANYVENGLTEVLKKVTRWEELERVQTLAADKLLQTPLLMIGTPDADIDLADQDTKTPTIRMVRLASRIDVANLAHDILDATKGFRLESAQLFQPRRYSYLLPGNAARASIPTDPFYQEITVANPPDNDPTLVSALYVYENDNMGPDDTKTFVRINGKLFGRPYSKDIPLKKKDENEQKPGDPIALARNHRYTVNITAPVENGPVEWEFNVVDWTEGTQVDIGATVEKPVIAAPDLSQATTANWNAAKKTYTFDIEKQETVKFKVTALRTPFLNMQFEYGDPAMVGLENPNNQAYKDFVKANSIVTYSKVEQTFEISTPKLVDPDYKAPILITLKLEDPSNRYFADSIKFKIVPKYLDTQYKPVLLGGVYWAPVNVGATDIMGSATPATASDGYYFQWGRNTPFDSTTDYRTDTVHVANTDYKKATEGADKDKFVIGNDISKNDWIAKEDPGYYTRNRLWHKDVNKSPCPKGWRVPTKAELEKIRTGAQTAVAAEYRTKVTGDESGEFLYLPLAGLRFSNSTVITSRLSQFRLWSSEPGTDENSWNIYNKVTQALFRGHALSIRCVQY